MTDSAHAYERSTCLGLSRPSHGAVPHGTTSGAVADGRPAATGGSPRAPRVAPTAGLETNSAIRPPHHLLAAGPPSQAPSYRLVRGLQPCRVRLGRRRLRGGGHGAAARRRHTWHHAGRGACRDPRGISEHFGVVPDGPRGGGPTPSPDPREDADRDPDARLFTTTMTASAVVSSLSAC